MICIWRAKRVPDPVLRGQPCRWWIKNVWCLSSLITGSVALPLLSFLPFYFRVRPFSVSRTWVCRSLGQATTAHNHKTSKLAVIFTSRLKKRNKGFNGDYDSSSRLKRSWSWNSPHFSGRNCCLVVSIQWNENTQPSFFIGVFYLSWVQEKYTIRRNKNFDSRSCSI